MDISNLNNVQEFLNDAQTISEIVNKYCNRDSMGNDALLPERQEDLYDEFAKLYRVAMLYNANISIDLMHLGKLEPLFNITYKKQDDAEYKSESIRLEDNPTDTRKKFVKIEEYIRS